VAGPVQYPDHGAFLGGCAIGDSPASGVIGPYHRVYGHLGLHVVDGSAVSANLGVNPSLTITAQVCGGGPWRGPGLTGLRRRRHKAAWAG
jgi:GMC oxidoreductase